MTAQFRLTQPAVRDIEEIADRLALQSSLENSERFLSALESKFSKIIAFPRIGRKRDEILSNMRSMPIENYVIFYILIGDEIEILRVVSGYRDLKTLFEE